MRVVLIEITDNKYFYTKQTGGQFCKIYYLIA